MVLTDLLSLSLSALIAYRTRRAIGPTDLEPVFFFSLALLILIVISIYAWQKLYPGIGMDQAVELQRISMATSIGVVLVAASTFWLHSAVLYSRLTILFMWMLALVLVPLFRAVIRWITISLDIWGEPVAIIGNQLSTKALTAFLLDQPQTGYRPTVLVETGETNSVRISTRDLNAVADAPEQVVPILKRLGIQTVIMINSSTPPALYQHLIYGEHNPIQRVIVLSNLEWVRGIGVISLSLDGYVGLQVSQNLLSSWSQRIKRLMDLLISLVTGIFIFPLFVSLAVLIRLDSPGPAFYKHKRLGRYGKSIDVWKFRTMTSDADQALEKYLADNPSMKQEWQISNKLKDDPRVTRMGKFLRKFSLDELPQLWNVVVGDMSIVGPRPIVLDEIRFYGKSYELYSSVRPGITGLWQISGRSDVGYASRVRLDEYYVRNWSIWLDIVIIAQTVPAVIKANGAY